MSDVTVIGLGEMGSALARALLRAGHRVTVWNRTAAKMEPLVQAGAEAAPDAAAAVAAAPLVLVCLSDYEATRAALGGATEAALRGRLLVQLSTGTPQQAREAALWATACGADFLDGAIFAWPSHIGGEETVILVSGPEPLFRQAQPLLRSLAGGLRHQGEAIGGTAALFAAVLSYLAGRWIGLCHGALICEAEGLSVSGFGALLADFAVVLGEDARHMGAVIESGRFGEPESALQTAGRDIARLVQLSEEDGIDARFPRFAAGLFREATEAGYGAEEHAALIKLLRG